MVYLGSALLWHLLGAISLSYQRVPHYQYKRPGPGKHNTSSVEMNIRKMGGFEVKYV